MSVIQAWRLAVLAASLWGAGPLRAQEPPESRDYDEPPKIVKQTHPQYPERPFREGVEGVVLIEFTIDEKGRVKEMKVLKSVPGLDEAALECVKKWRFTPARKAGRVVATRAQAPVGFRIFGRKQQR